ITDFRAYAAEPGADVLRAASHLTGLSGWLATNSHASEAVQAQRAGVDLLAGFSAAAALRRDYLLALAEGRYYLVLRLIADQQLEEAGGLTDQTITDFRAYAAEPGADVLRAASHLTGLSGWLATNGRDAQAAAARQAAQDLGI
ncbi:hypothetical protein, partial [Streptomyces sp. NPDC058695]|uniref:hypothetical protein n=1 Tax=Streptomyces sp. NPDC058695 TaxID=3346604 RepID=UPI0036525B0E